MVEKKKCISRSGWDTPKQKQSDRTGERERERERETGETINTTIAFPHLLASSSSIIRTELEDIAL